MLKLFINLDKSSNIFKNKYFRALLLLFPIYIAIIFIYFGISFNNAESVRSLISTLIQSEAAILAIVVPLSIVAVQLTASSYSLRVINIFKGVPSLWILIGIYIFAISFGLIILGLIDTSTTAELENYILFAYFIGIFSLGALIPYIIDILDLMKPITVINKLAKDITKKNILDAIEKEEYHFYREGRGPVQPLIDIMHSALVKYDYGTFRDVLEAIEKQYKFIINSEEMDYIEENSIANNLFIHHITQVGRLAINMENEEIAEEIIKSSYRLGKCAAEGKLDSFAMQAAQSIGTTGEMAISKKHDRIANSANVYLGVLGEEIAKHDLAGATEMVIHSSIMMGRAFVEQDLNNNNTFVSVIVEEDVLDLGVLINTILIIESIIKVAEETNNEEILIKTKDGLILLSELNKTYKKTDLQIEIEKDLKEIEFLLDKNSTDYSNLEYGNIIVTDRGSYIPHNTIHVESSDIIGTVNGPKGYKKGEDVTIEYGVINTGRETVYGVKIVGQAMYKYIGTLKPKETKKFNYIYYIPTDSELKEAYGPGSVVGNPISIGGDAIYYKYATGLEYVTNFNSIDVKLV